MLADRSRRSGGSFLALPSLTIQRPVRAIVNAARLPGKGTGCDFWNSCLAWGERAILPCESRGTPGTVLL
jgi:hypothetical protein